MDTKKDGWLQKVVSPGGVSTALAGATLVAIGWIWKPVLLGSTPRVRPMLSAINELMPQTALDLMPATLFLATLLGLFVFLLNKRELRLKNEQPRFTGRFGVNWRYVFDGTKMVYERQVYCPCHEKPCATWGHMEKDKYPDVLRYACPFPAKGSDGQFLLKHEATAEYLGFEEAYRLVGQK